MDSKQLALQYHLSGKFNCCQSVIKGFCDSRNIECDQLLSATSTFGRGLNSGCVCGALAGAELVLGLIYSKDVSIARQKSSEMHNRFKEKFKATCCRVLKGKETGRCSEFVVGAIEILEEIIK
jgi:C_GCAxxG_C_C family probable redox protein